MKRIAVHAEYTKSCKRGLQDRQLYAKLQKTGLMFSILINESL